MSQFEYASSLALTELVIDRHHHEVALRQVSSGRRGGRRGLVVVSCATSGREKLVGAATRPCAGRATLEWSRDCGRADLEGRERLRSVVYVGLGSLRSQTAGEPAVLLLVTNFQTGASQFDSLVQSANSFRVGSDILI